MSDRIATEDYADSLVMSGPTGADGADGEDGAPGATGATGPEGLNWRGAWNSGTAYAIDDAVSFGGSSWISIQAGTNHSPADDTWWDPLSAKGDTGTTGSTGATGAAGADATAIYGDPVTVAKGGTGQTSLASLKTAMTFVKGDVGLGNVDNTADASKTFTESQVTNLVTDLAAKAVPAPFGRIKYGAGPTVGYQLPGVAITSTSTVAHSVNTDYTYLLYTPTPITIDQLAFNVTAAPASNANVALAVYSVVDGQPTGAPLCSGTVAVASAFTGIKTLSPGATVIPAGPFAVCLNSDVVMTMTSWRGGVVNGYIFSIAANTGFQGGFVARTYAAFTSSPTAWTGAMNNVGDHGVVLRVSTP